MDIKNINDERLNVRITTNRKLVDNISFGKNIHRNKPWYRYKYLEKNS